jgi:hypothetical protein
MMLERHWSYFLQNMENNGFLSRNVKKLFFLYF